MKPHEPNLSELSDLWVTEVHKLETLEKVPRDFGAGDFLNRTEIHIIMTIGDHSDLNITSLSEHLGITKSAISQVIRKLSHNNLVKKYRNYSQGAETP